MLINTKGMTNRQLKMVTAILQDKSGKLKFTEKEPTQYEYFSFNELIKKKENKND
ncbi:MAG: hypothetical protein MJ060_04315 [Clostridia bacterium]|nr:hypothetical protein [Clostridia bacterium]